MNTREEVALEHGDIKLFLMADEIALLVSCLAWWKAELTTAGSELQKLDMPIVAPIKSQVPNDAFHTLIPVIESTIESLLVHSAAHLDERSDAEGKASFEEKLKQMESATRRIQELRHLVSMGTTLQALSQQQKTD